ncbi:hypothetical protein OXB_3012 [Bacillus sp. OxB-1]|uniref:hypothetical protein n=1 Tax=Bacillus sp. (strain OxB-1) TaxID=98228 RepID=UPI000581B803|nr:hypothetical protein [Bacillus sp. OxB-1]BAQ11482.1 hypothetical protein OXB_3012 [Bacillus sp. OxB-1]
MVTINPDQEIYAAECCLRVAFKRLKKGDYEQALKRTEDAIRSLKVLRENEKTD